MAEKDWGTRYHLSQLASLSVNNRVQEFGKVLNESQHLLEDIPIMPSNEMLSYKGNRVSSIPTPQIIKVGDGWSASVVQWTPFSEVISMFKDRCQIPEDVLRIQPEPAAERKLIESQHIEGFGQGVCNHLVYGTSIAYPEKFDGLDVRYTTPDASDPTNPTNGNLGVYDMAGTGSDTTSIWLIQWGPTKAFGIHPINDPAMGIRNRDMKLQQVTAENSKVRYDYFTEFQMDLGFVVKDLRAIKRIRNIESALSAISTDLTKKIIEAKNDFEGNETVWIYCNNRMFTHIDLLTMDKQNVKMSSDNPYGKPLLMFRDSPIRKCPSITNTETAVAAA
jgi:hypothetical protein